MAKAQLKKKPGKASKSAPKSSAARPKHAAAGKAAAKKIVAKVARVLPKKKAAPVKAKAAKAAKPAKAVKPARPVKAAKPAKAAPKAAKAAKPAKAQSKPAKLAAKGGKVVAAAVAKVQKVASKVAATPVVAKAAAAVAKVSAAVEKKRARRARTRLTSGGPAVANWFSQEKARPSSFIPAPPRAEAPSLVAAPPASSDRLIRPEDLIQQVVRTVPVRVDIEQGGGRVFVAVNPQEVVLRPGEGIEWDFRYIGGADVTVDEVLIEFDRPSPFGTAQFRSHKPGSARPHRQLSGAAANSAAGRRVQYSIRAMTSFRTELASARPSVNILVA